MGPTSKEMIFCFADSLWSFTSYSYCPSRKLPTQAHLLSSKDIFIMAIVSLYIGSLLNEEKAERPSRFRIKTIKTEKYICTTILVYNISKYYNSETK